MPSVMDAEEALRATERKENFLRLTRLLMCGGVRILREKFDSIHPPTGLPLTLDDTATRDSLKAAKLFKAQWDCLYPSPGTFGKSTDFDITLMFRLFRTICNLTEPVTKWNNPPSSTDYSLEADLIRIKEYRDSVHGHSSTMEITGSEFRHLWKEISEALLRIVRSMSVAKWDEWKNAINKLLSDPLTPEAQRYVDELQIWYKNDMELKDAVKQLEDQVRQGNEDIRDQLQHFNDQLQQLNQRLAIDYRIPLIVIVVTPSHLPMVVTSAMAAASESMVTVRINEEKPQCDRRDPQTESYIWRVILSPALNRLQSVLEYLKVQLGVSTVDCTVGSLMITVTCSSLQILEGLWEDYSSGRLNKVIGQTLVTPDVLEKLGLSELELKTTISEEEYKKCRELFLSEHQRYDTSGNVEDEEKGKQEQEQEGLLQLRNELMNYDFQKCPRIKREAFQDLVVDDIDLIRIAVIGPTGAGKTSLVGTLQRTLKEPQTATDPDLERCEGVFLLEEHYVQKKIRVVDTRGYSVNDEHLEDELLEILSGRRRPGDEIVRGYDIEGDHERATMARRTADLSEYVHAVIFVVDANDPHLMDGKYRDKLQTIRERLSQEGYAPVTAITFRNKLILKEKEKDVAYKMALKTTGSSRQTTFFITNYITPEHDKTSCEVERAALNILDSALVSAERFIQFRMQQEQNHLEKEVVVEGSPGDRETIQQFVARVGKKHNWTDQGRMKAVLKNLFKLEIRVFEVFKALWEDIAERKNLQSELQLPNYERVDRTDPQARAQGQQKAQEENERRMEELRDEIERSREQALRDAQELARTEDDAERRRLDRQRREREEKERRQKEEQRFCRLKDELMNYNFQTSPRIRKESFRDLEVGDIDVLRIALIGPTGSGKSSFVGTVQRAIGVPQAAFEQGTGKEGTIILEEYFVQEKVRMVDTRGFFSSDEKLLEECLNIMSGRIRPGEEILRTYDRKGASQESDAAAKRAVQLSKYAHAVIFVVKANDPRLTDGNYKDTLQKIREHFREDGYAPVTVITYLDKLKEKEDKDEAFDQASWATGSSSERTYFIANYIPDVPERSPETDRAALDILDSALLSAERFIQIRKQREKNQMEREAAAGGVSSGTETVEQFFSRLQKKYKWTDQGKLKAVLETLGQQEIKTTDVLKDLWEDVKSELPLSMGMKIALEEEIKRL